MKRFRKDRKPEEVKNPLLQAYFSSLLSLVLCMTMFLGTSYAWFTSEVTNTGNEIYIGTLDVGMYKDTGADTWTDLASNSTSNQSTKLFDQEIRWEPGYTALETIKIVNEGTLNFKYIVSFIENTSEETPSEGESAQSETEQVDVAQYFDVWVYEHTSDKEYEKPESYQDINENNGWLPIGTLKEVLAGKSVLEGDKLEKSSTAGEYPSHTYTIALHMRDDADAAVMGQQITLNVKLVAYQLMYENGDMSNTTEEIVGVTNLETLTQALTESKKVLLTADIVVDDVEDRVTMAGGVLDGNHNTITYEGDREGENSVGVLTCNGGTLRNVTIAGGENGRALYVTTLNSDLFVSNCTLSGAYAFNLNSADETDHIITFTKTTFESWTSYANAAEHVYFTGCTFKDTLKPYGDTTLTDCTFASQKLDVSALEDGESITFVNCTYGETESVDLVVKNTGGTITRECEETVITEIDSNGYLIFGIEN